jgi:hypothetical protein
VFAVALVTVAMVTFLLVAMVQAGVKFRNGKLIVLLTDDAAVRIAA